MRKLLLATLVLLVAACGNDNNAGQTGPDRSQGGNRDTGAGTGGTGSTDDDTGGVSGLDVGTGGTGEGDGTGGTGGTGSDTGGTGGDREYTEVEIMNECGDIEFVAGDAYRAADIIWVIDGSESMDNEIAHVRANIANFVDRIEDSGIDVRMVMVASKETRSVNQTVDTPMGPITAPSTYHGICVPPPLSAAPGCPDTDNPPYFVHPDVNVYSTDALKMLMTEGYPQFRNVLRRHARTHIVVVTDDRSAWTAQQFLDSTRLVDPPGFSLDWVLHGIIGLGECRDGDGAVYKTLANMTGGKIMDVCQADWTPIFDTLLEGVVGNAELPCAYGLPAPGDGFELIPSQVNVFFTPEEGDRQLVPGVNGAADCGDGVGWYYDDPRDPHAIYVCPTLCGAAALGTIDMTFGCGTIKR